MNKWYLFIVGISLSCRVTVKITSKDFRQAITVIMMTKSRTILYSLVSIVHESCMICLMGHEIHARERNQCPPLNFLMWVTEDFCTFLIDDRVGLPSRQHLPALGILRVCIEDRWEILGNKKWKFEISINLVTALWFLFKSEICAFNETSRGMHSFQCVFVFTRCQTFSSTLFLDLSMLEIWDIVWLCWIFAGLWQLFF